MKQPTQQSQQDLLKFVSIGKQSAEQKQFRYVKAKGYLHKLTRDPAHLDEFDWQQMRGYLAMWRKNGTILCVSQFMVRRGPDKHVHFTLDCGGITYLFEIYGQSNAAIAETATFFWSLQPSGNVSDPPDAGTLAITSVSGLDVSALSAKQLARILDSNPIRSISFLTGTWNAAQSVVLATRPYPFKITVASTPRGTFAFTDGGKAFVDALQTRKSSFGSLRMDFPDRMPLSHANLQRLFELEDTFDELDVWRLNRESMLLPFSAKVKVLIYEIHSTMMQPNDFDSIDIAAKDLHLKMYLNDADGWERLPISLLDRVSALGNFEKLCLWIDTSRRASLDETELLAEALIRAIKGNPRLAYLNLSDNIGLFDWTPYLQNVFEAMEDHTGLIKLVVDDIELEDDDHASWLKKLLSRNRNIVVLDGSGSTYSDKSIAELYSLNRFCCGSAKLVRASASLRSQLVTAALTENASNNFQCTALLLAQHTDMLCEFVEDWSQN